ncbi:MAG: succinate dehydrogenase, cytochrome b556 subunit [Gammaproteobacteria bacterium]|nr:succinate dehydrogenase, cytochrome b556 subunit [Gammaproteobacteria bacterium]
MSNANRPLSPHLQVYRPQLTSILSIVHRGSGVFLTVGTPLLVWWFVAVARGGESFARAQTFFGSGLGRLLIFLWSLALFYHLCNGVRHLVWDIGEGFEMDTVYRSGYAVVIVAAVLTLTSWVLAYAMRGG